MSGKKIANWTVGKIIAAQLTALACVLAAVPPAAAIGPCEAIERFDARKVRGAARGRPPFALGDSVMLGAAAALARAGLKVDARGCRQMKDGLDLLARRKRRHRLPRVVIVALGTNLDITRADVRRGLRILDRRQLLVLVTPREEGGGAGSDAAVIRRAGRNHPHRVCVADWVRYSAGHPSWFGGDGIHLGPAGIRGFVRLLKRYRRVRPPQRSPCP